jgi:hypothetical protein
MKKLYFLIIAIWEYQLVVKIRLVPVSQKVLMGFIKQRHI